MKQSLQVINTNFVEDELDNFLQFNRFLGFIINNIILYSMLLWRVHHYPYFFTIVMVNAAEHRTRFDNAVRLFQCRIASDVNKYRSTKRLKELDWQPLNQRYKTNKSIFMHRKRNEKMPSSISNMFKIRINDRYDLRSNNNNYDLGRPETNFQPRTQALSTTRLAGGKTLVQAGHVSPRFLHKGGGLSFILPI